MQSKRPLYAGILERLRGAGLFSRFDHEFLEAIASTAILKTARRKETIVASGSHFPYLGVLLAGEIFVTATLRSASGSIRPCALFLSRAPDTFAEFSVLDGAGAVGNIIALTDIEYALIDQRTISQAMDRHSAFRERIVSQALARGREAIERLCGNIALPMPARVAAILLPYAASEPGLHPADPKLKRMTQAQLAAFAGSAKEVFARTVAELEQSGSLRREHGHIAYLDADRLKELAAGSLLLSRPMTNVS